MKVTFLGLAVEVPVFLVAVTSLSERAGQTFIFWMTMLPILRAPCFICGLFNQSRTFAGGIRYMGVSCMWMLVNWTTPSQLFYIDETGALCHAMSGLAVDILGMYFFFYQWLHILTLNTNRQRTNSSSPSSCICSSQPLVSSFTYIHLRKISDSSTLFQRSSNARLFRGNLSWRNLEIR